MAEYMHNIIKHGVSSHLVNNLVEGLIKCDLKFYTHNCYI